MSTNGSGSSSEVNSSDEESSNSISESDETSEPDSKERESSLVVSNGIVNNESILNGGTVENSTKDLKPPFDDEDDDDDDDDDSCPPPPPPLPFSSAEMTGLLSQLTGGSELREAEDKFRKAMIGNAQLDNEKSAAAYQVELYKDRLEELGEEYSQLQREHRDKCRQYEQMKRDSEKLAKDLEMAMAALAERDRLIQEQGLVIVGGDETSSDEGDDETGQGDPTGNRRQKRALVSADSANLLSSVTGSLDVRLKKLSAERNELSDELRHVKLELEEERNRGRGIGPSSPDIEDLQREANKQLADYKFKLQKAEQDVSTLQATVARLEGQVNRYKTSTESAEKVEDELKLERRKLQRELRECQSRVEELETANSHLQKRLDKLKTAKSALLKDL